MSRSTVSYALSGKRTISDETRERIELAVRELGFTPNAGARALATSQTMVIGLLVQFFRDEFSPAMLQYVLPISDAAREAGYDILMVTEDDGPRALKRITDSDMVDGVVLLNVAHDDPRVKPCAPRGSRAPSSVCRATPTASTSSTSTSARRRACSSTICTSWATARSC
ncbi:LacI family DNA-binding transcriptional regulator [Homoserinibacter gongjuensis]|uniref:LacI family DNA-binding transcriptional regulator n=1 Tax=Homoserinibacter gongjuensis TaxID=1162968 RepID=UPI0024E0B0E7|nr:LacI family DNA-binding transcriptional regulator [Homoserinibacter gongjuensis]